MLRFFLQLAAFLKTADHLIKKIFAGIRQKTCAETGNHAADGQSHHQEPNLPNLMEKPVNKARRIRYNLYDIFGYWSYLIISWIADSSESVFCF